MGKRKKGPKKKNNKYDNLSKPDGEFDFHDRGVLRMDEVREMADDFLAKAERLGWAKVLFITGKGLHSRKGMPVIKPYLKKYLLTKPFVMRVYEGRRDRGGSGTLEVALNFDD